MKLSQQEIDSNGHEILEKNPSMRLSFMKFLMRYPIFLLAFGPPIFRSEGIDATQGIIDIWALFQVGLIGVIALRAFLHLNTAESILIPKQVRSVLKYASLLGALFLASSLYSPSRTASAAYSVLYFFTLICIVEFIVDVYRNPPNWMQCLFSLRTIFLLLFALAIITLIFRPGIVMKVEEGAGIHFGGGTVAPLNTICPMIAIISAYAFLYSLESRVKSTVLFLIGFAGTLTGQSRGSELSLILCLVILGAAWAKTNKRAAFIFTFSLIVSILFSGAVVASIGGGRIWNTFNKGENIQTIESASGRSEIWKFVLHYCMDHPQGMGYIAGFRMIFREQYASGLHVTVNNIGNSHNSFIDILADAGWLALAVYLIIIVKIVLLAWRYGKKRGLAAMASDAASQHVIRCALVLLVSCLANGMDTADYNVPLKATFYVQYLIIAIILGLSARMIASSRARHISSGK